MYRGHPNPYARARPDLPWPPVEDDPKSRLIPKKLWDLKQVKVIAQAQLDHENENLILAITKDCVRDIQRLELTAPDLANYILQLDDHHYDESLWCQKSMQEGVKIDAAAIWCPCDSYVLPVQEKSDSGIRVCVEYYIKFCLSPANKSVLLVSFHL